MISIGEGAFDGCSRLKDVYSQCGENPWYKWNKSLISTVSNDYLLNATMHFNYVYEDTVVSSGKYGSNITYTLHGNGLLELNGSGKMTGSAPYNYLYNGGAGVCGPYSNIAVKVTLSENITSIGTYAFQYCTSMTSVTIPASVTSIDSCAFEHCDNLADVYFTGSESDWQNITISDGNTSLTSATIHYNS